jgi:ribosome-binding ATPase
LLTQKICKKYPQHTLVPTSALAECFLKKMRSQNFIIYADGGDTFLTSEDGGEAAGLKVLDDKTKKRLENVKDLVLFRYLKETETTE